MKQKCYYIFQINQNNNWMFRGSSYSIQTDKDISFSHLLEERVNIALVGVSDVGKSSLLNCIEKERFTEDIPPTNDFQLRFKRIRINHHLLVNLSVWDGNGDRMLEFIKDGRLQHFDGVLYVYDLTNPNSVVQLQQLRQELIRSYRIDLVSLVVGNKADLLNVPPTESPKGIEAHEAYYLACKFCERHSLIHQNVSAKLNSCVTDCFVLLIKEILGIKRHIRTSRLGEEEQQPIEQVVKKCSCCSCPVM